VQERIYESAVKRAYEKQSRLYIRQTRSKVESKSGVGKSGKKKKLLKVWKEYNLSVYLNSNFIRRYLKKKNKSQASFARDIGICKQFFWELMNRGKSVPMWVMINMMSSIPRGLHDKFLISKYIE